MVSWAGLRCVLFSVSCLIVGMGPVNGSITGLLMRDAGPDCQGRKEIFEPPDSISGQKVEGRDMRQIDQRSRHKFNSPAALRRARFGRLSSLP